MIEEAIATLGIPGSIAVVIVMIFAVLQLIGELLSALGKVTPAFMGIRKWLKRKSDKRKKEQEDIAKTLKDVKIQLTDVNNLLSEVNKHYSQDNITQRDEWISWVNSKASVYDEKVEELIQLRASLDAIASALAENTKTTDEMFKESCRDRIINFASKVTNPLELVSHEEFRRIFKVYNAYEAFLEARNEPNGEVETNYALIREAYAERVKTHNFIEDIRHLPQQNI